MLVFDLSSIEANQPYFSAELLIWVCETGSLQAVNVYKKEINSTFTQYYIA